MRAVRIDWSADATRILANAPRVDWLDMSKALDVVEHFAYAIFEEWKVPHARDNQGDISGFERAGIIPGDVHVASALLNQVHFARFRVGHANSSPERVAALARNIATIQELLTARNANIGRHYLKRTKNQPKRDLSDTDREVLADLKKGLLQKVVADRRGMSERNVRKIKAKAAKLKAEPN